MAEKKIKGKAWVVALSNELQYQRISYALRNFAPSKKIINIDYYENIPKEDKNFWELNKKFYKLILNIQQLPIIGEASLNILNQFEKIKKFYFKNEENIDAGFILKQIYNLIQKGWGKHFIETLKNKNKEIPFISMFSIPIFMAEYYNYPSKIGYIICNPDIPRYILPINLYQSKTIYFVSMENIVEKLLKYGIKHENIFLTGYPLPKENIGKYKKYEIAKANLKNRILNLSPKKNYEKTYHDSIKKYVGKLPLKSNHKLTIMFSAENENQQKIGLNILKSLSYTLENKLINFIIGCGTNEDCKQFFLKEILKLKLGLNVDNNIFIIHDLIPEKYIQLFNEALNQTDLLWTNPNELIFYAGLGIPIIISPPQNSYEKINEKWLMQNKAGIKQQNPKYTNEWLFDLIRDGVLVETALNGFLNIKKDGVWEIEKIIKYSALF